MEQESLEIRNIKQEIKELKEKRLMLDKEIYNRIEYLYGIGSFYDPQED